jgi:hypothetical protein
MARGGMGPKRKTWLAVAAATASFVVALVVTSTVIAAGSPATAFAWFRAQTAPQDWAVAETGNGSVLTFPKALRLVPADPGARSAQETAATGAYVAYVNATPWDAGPVPLSDWAASRRDELTDDDQAVHVQARAAGLAFLGGARGSCVTDSYTSRAKAKRYRELACVVEAGNGRATVVVAAASSYYWSKSLPMLEQAVEAFRAQSVSGGAS